ncbi:MAG TPA: GNAT family N-acetyltransferase [Anaerolineales bacterium]|nr:GNAT family N-acetyltransferase [Anaerolineales bacterium]
MEISVRKATADDYNSLCELFSEVDALHRDHLPHLFQKPGGAAREQDYYSELIADENAALLVAEAGEKLVGFVHAFVREPPAMPVFVPRRYVIADSIVVSSEFQNQGIGGTLMDKMQEWAIEKGATSIELNVYEFNQSAISFYERLGYQSLSRKMSREIKKD